MPTQIAGRGSAKPAVLFLVPWSPEYAGGVNTVVKALYREAERGHDFAPIIAVNDWDALDPVWDDLPTLRILRVRIPPAPGSPARYLQYLLWFAIWGQGLLRLLKIEHVTAVNIHYPSSSAWFFVFARRLGLWRGRMVLSYHGVDIEGGTRLAGGERRRYLDALEHADAITTCSVALMRRLKSAFGVSLARCTTPVHNGADTESCVSPSSVRARARMPVRTVLNVGTYEWKKGQDVLLRAFSRLDGKELHLRLIGRSGPALESLRGLSNELGVADRVEFLTNLTHAQVQEHCRASHIFVMASREEPFGIAVLEAGAAGLPVIATSVGGVVEFLEDGANALLVDTEDVDALARRLHHMLGDADLRERLALQLNADVRSKFSWNAAWKQYLNVLCSGGPRDFGPGTYGREK